MAVVLGLGIGLLPDGSTTSDPSVSTLPEPVAATTVSTIRRDQVAVVGTDSFPLLTVSGLDGFVGFTKPIELGGRHWIIGTPPTPFERPVVLSSLDGTRWTLEAENGPGPISIWQGQIIRVEALVRVGDELVAAGTIGTDLGRPYLSITPGDLTVWRSGNGRDWTAETVLAGDGSTEYWVGSLVSSGLDLLLVASSQPTSEPNVIEAVPPEYEEALTRGDLYLEYSRDRVWIRAVPGIEVFSAPYERDEFGSYQSVNLRSGSDRRWEPFDLGVDALGYAALPGGGFIANNYEGPPQITSNVVDWQAHPEIPNAKYGPWGDRLVGLGMANPGRFVIVKGGEFTGVRFPEEMRSGGASVTQLSGSERMLVATTASYTPGTANPSVRSGGYTVRVSDLGYLEIENSTGEQIYRRLMAGTETGIYDPATNLVTLVDEETGHTFGFPADHLRGLWHHVSMMRADVFLSADGFTWDQAQTGLITGGWTTVLGVVGDSFLIAVNSSGDWWTRDAATLTVVQTGPVG